MQYVVIEPQENTMGLPLVMDAKDSLEEVFGKSMHTVVDFLGTALSTKTREINAAIAD